jgi:hypothetical protein
MTHTSARSAAAIIWICPAPIKARFHLQVGIICAQRETGLSQTTCVVI